MAFKLFKEKYHKLNRENLANAISVYAKRINTAPGIDSVNVHEVIILSKVLKLNVFFSKSTLCDKTYFSMNITTYVEDIRMAEYAFDLCSSSHPSPHDFHTKWGCRNVEIIHYMPNQFIDLMNNWSKEIVSEYEKEHNEVLRKKEDSAKRNHDKEESILSKYR